MMTWKWLATGLVVGACVCATNAQAQEPESADAPPKPAKSRVAAVTVYQGNALVTREVDVPEGKGMVEVVVTPLPPQTIDSSLYTEGADGLRVLSTRYRTRAVKEDTRKEVRAKEEQIRKLKQQTERMQKEHQVLAQNLQTLAKLENFTAATMQQLAEKGLLDSAATLKLTNFIMETRAEKSSAQVDLEEKLDANAEATQFAERELGELTSGSSRTERDAVIVVDRNGAGAAGKVRLNYLVGGATWRPQYRFRAGAEKDPVQLEYLAAVEQQTGEAWPDVDMTLSTAQPQLNATPPELLALDITVVGRGALVARNALPGNGPQQGVQMGGMGGGMGMMGGGRNQNQAQGQGQGQAANSPFGAMDRRGQSSALRKRAQQELVVNNFEAGKAIINDAAALEQAEELLAARDDRDEKEAEPKVDEPPPATAAHEGPSVTYHLRSRLTVPSRNDQQLIEVARIETKPDYYYKAVPVLTTHVYRLADLVNKSAYVLLPGEATMYVGTDFVGRMDLPLVAIGERYTVGFGVDPQLQVSRQLVKKSRSVQGGNQVHTYEYRIAVGSFKSEPVKVRVWDRLPRAEAEAVAVSLVEPSPKLSSDPVYVRRERPENLLRWDLTVEPGQNGESAAAIAYQFKLEYARDVAIADFKAKK